MDAQWAFILAMLLSFYSYLTGHFDIGIFILVPLFMFIGYNSPRSIFERFGGKKENLYV